MKELIEDIKFIYKYHGIIAVLGDLRGKLSFALFKLLWSRSEPEITEYATTIYFRHKIFRFLTKRKTTYRRPVGDIEKVSIKVDNKATPALKKLKQEIDKMGKKPE